MKRVAFALVLASAALPVHAQINFYLQDRLILGASGLAISPTGSSPSAIASDGNNVYIGSWNTSGATANTEIYRISNAWGAFPTVGLLSGTSTSTANQRGFNALAFDSANNQLLASYDPGANSVNGIRAFQPASGTLNWSAFSTRGAGVALDPGFGGSGDGVGFGTLFSGRRLLVDDVTGATIYNTSTGMVWRDGALASASTNVRDVDFDAAGNMYLRAANNVYAADRNGANSLTNQRFLVNTSNSGLNAAGQNLAVFSSSFGTTILYNDRPDVLGSSNVFSNSMRAVTTSGSSLSLNWYDSDGTNLLLFGNTVNDDIANGNGWYDMVFDPNGSLLVLDFANEQVYRFTTAPVPEPMSVVAIGAGLVLLRRRRNRDKQA